ncbi:histidine-type phosphatase [Hoylesella marshii]|uniref:histidine-type phosphatase n=1 Tax=Hoylesella marshii TaxID=189722 RepID=UPI0028D19CFF|nr:histidine-type phosphatase [Hoylesella marshii]
MTAIKMRFSFLLAVVFLLPCQALAQTSREEIYADLNKAGGVYRAYPLPTQRQTPPPRGYRPFYISHYSRHGSRYLIGDRDYKWVLDLMRRADTADALSPLGKDVHARLEKLWTIVEGHGGDLSPVGVAQHQGIARRMYRSFPEVFGDHKHVSARSTVSLRCNMSMMAFGDALKGECPNLNISYETGERFMRYLCYSTDSANAFTNHERGPWVEEYRKFRNEQTRPERMMHALFTSDDFVRREVNPEELMWGFYWIAVDMQDIVTDLSFYDLFTKEELFDLWQVNNYRFYVTTANHTASRGITIANAAPLLRNIIETADTAISDGRTAATFRFGHDGNIIPLLALMRVGNFNASTARPEDVYHYWCDFQASPMAANLQLVFFKNKKQHVLVKLLHNEQEVHIPVETSQWPYYDWKAVKAYYDDLLLHTYHEN